jgi:hypothetical protein
VRALVISLLMVCSGAAGYLVPTLLNPSHFKTVSFVFPDQSKSASITTLGCRAITEGAAFEQRYDSDFQGPSANARAARSEEKLALELSPDGKVLSVLYAFDFGNGMTEPLRLNVHSKSSSYIVAQGQQLLGETAVILDAKTLKAVVSFTGQGRLGIKGWSYLVQCD